MTLRLASLVQRGVNNVREAGLIPVQAIHLRLWLNGPSWSFPSLKDCSEILRSNCKYYISKPVLVHKIQCQFQIVQMFLLPMQKFVYSDSIRKLFLHSNWFCDLHICLNILCFRDRWVDVTLLANQQLFCVLQKIIQCLSIWRRKS